MSSMSILPQDLHTLFPFTRIFPWMWCRKHFLQLCDPVFTTQTRLFLNMLSPPLHGHFLLHILPIDLLHSAYHNLYYLIFTSLLLSNVFDQQTDRKTFLQNYHSQMLLRKFDSTSISFSFYEIFSNIHF